MTSPANSINRPSKPIHRRRTSKRKRPRMDRKQPRVWRTAFIRKGADRYMRSELEARSRDRTSILLAHYKRRSMDRRPLHMESFHLLMHTHWGHEPTRKRTLTPSPCPGRVRVRFME